LFLTIGSGLLRLFSKANLGFYSQPTAMENKINLNEKQDSSGFKASIEFLYLRLKGV
jgi:hypothetical protein